MRDRFKVIDMHVHIAGRGDVWPEDLWWSERFEEGIGFKALAILKGWSSKQVGDELMRTVLSDQATMARRIDLAVVLAFDNVYDPDGTYRGPQRAKREEVFTTLYVSNQYVVDLCESYPKKLLPGISVHPFRPDALEELDKYKDRAALCKWMPSAQLIDFESSVGQPKLERFYAKLAEIKLPLLLHTGIETSIPTVDKSFERFNSARFVERALDLGATVIVAHCGCSYFDLLQDNMVDDTIRLFQKMEAEGKDWGLYADISALFSPFRRRKILDRIFAEIPAERLVYGSDFPNPAKGRREPFLRPFLRYRKANLLNRSARIARRWLKHYFPDSDARADRIMTGFHRLLESLGRGGQVPGS
jgi:predicted TIM-barrel fold metal-dependent hydrolase